MTKVLIYLHGNRFKERLLFLIIKYNMSHIELALPGEETDPDPAPDQQVMCSTGLK